MSKYTLITKDGETEHSKKSDLVKEIVKVEKERNPQLDFSKTKWNIIED